MKVVIQRCQNASVKVNNELINQIETGMMILCGFNQLDQETDLDYMVKKIINLRIFDDENKVMNKSILDINGSILAISQFTLYADTSKGNRPFYGRALKHDEAAILYNEFIQKLQKHVKCLPGVFGADMQVELINDGPVTIILDLQNK